MLLVFNRSQGSFDDVCPWESMEKLPDKDKGASSQSQSVTSTTQAAPSTSTAGIANKPSTSAAALMADSVKQTTSSPTTSHTTDSPKQVTSTSVTIPQPSKSITAPSTSASITQQESLVSKQGSVTSEASPGQPPSTSPTPSVSSSAALIDNQQQNKPAPPQHQPSIGSESGGCGTAEISSSTTSLSKESVIHASPSISIQSSAKATAEAVDCEVAAMTEPDRFSGTMNETVNDGQQTVDGSEKSGCFASMSPSISPPAYHHAPLATIPSASSSSASSSGNNKPSTTSNSTSASVADNKGNQEGQTGPDQDVCPWDHE